jgi:UDP-N-acetylglucosamine 2-epimerase (non-hydrolysing)
MSSPRIVVFMGTRPEAIKLAPVIRALEGSGDFEAVVVNTGQHRELMDPVARSLGLSAQHALGVMREGQGLADLTAAVLSACDAVLARIEPDFALVQGDTTTALAASLACFYRRVAVGHVEAGLRTHRRWAPFPEEVNRTLVSRLCELHFAPTEWAKQNLRAEGIPSERIAVTGNTVIDALRAELARQSQPDVRAAIAVNLGRSLGGIQARPFVLITGHRRENFGRPLEALCAALVTLAARFADHDFVYPVHMNPNVRATVHRELAGAGNVRLIEPLPYPEFVTLMRACRIVLTDSGGIQEEAPSLGKPVLVMREATERPEGVEAGTLRLVGPDAEAIVSEVSRLLSDDAAYEQMARAANPYGDGRAAERIIERLRLHLGARPQI